MLICRIGHAVLREDGAGALHQPLAAYREALHDSRIVAWYGMASGGHRGRAGGMPAGPAGGRRSGLRTMGSCPRSGV